MNNNPEAFHHLLDQIRNDFLVELPERCDYLEDLTFQLEKEPDDKKIFNEIFRAVHSLKGSGGIHGLTILTRLCHQFENLLNLFTNKSQLTESVISSIFTFIDLIRQIATLSLTEKKPDFSALEIAIEQIISRHFHREKSGFVIESSPMMASLYLQTLENLPIHLRVSTNGLEGLTVLLRESFDFIIVGKELNELNGIALIAALRYSQSQNANIPALFVTSKYSKNLDELSTTTVIQKDQNLADNLYQAVESIIS
ncbi:Hpt domain-containing protein [Aliikangiella maris]|uniref:Hpt domain-containing protein n=2 Tax=Aliikangiella maris TaxID=3162458 RepID=A0ABV2BWU4_9GAMM